MDKTRDKSAYLNIQTLRTAFGAVQASPAQPIRHDAAQSMPKQRNAVIEQRDNHIRKKAAVTPALRAGDSTEFMLLVMNNRTFGDNRPYATFYDLAAVSATARHQYRAGKRHRDEQQHRKQTSDELVHAAIEDISHLERDRRSITDEAWHRALYETFEAAQRLEKFGMVRSSWVKGDNYGLGYWAYQLTEKGQMAGFYKTLRGGSLHDAMKKLDTYENGYYEARDAGYRISIVSDSMFESNYHKLRSSGIIESTIHVERTKQSGDVVDFIDLTNKIAAHVSNIGAPFGSVTISPGQHAGGTMIKVNEAEELLMKDFRNHLSSYIPEELYGLGQKKGAQQLKDLIHNSSETIPILGSRLTLGTWQRLFLVDTENIKHHTLKLRVHVDVPAAVDIIEMRTKPMGFVDLKPMLNQFIAQNGISNGRIVVWSQHSTAGLKSNMPVSESSIETFRNQMTMFAPPEADQTLQDDMLYWNHNKMSLRKAPIADDEKLNAHAHLMNTLLSASAVIDVKDGKLQGYLADPFFSLYFVDADGPRDRKVVVAAFNQ